MQVHHRKAESSKDSAATPYPIVPRCLIKRYGVEIVRRCDPLR